MTGGVVLDHHVNNVLVPLKINLIVHMNEMSILKNVWTLKEQKLSQEDYNCNINNHNAIIISGFKK